MNSREIVPLIFLIAGLAVVMWGPIWFGFVLLIGSAILAVALDNRPEDRR
jgi:hypothetical protein